MPLPALPSDLVPRYKLRYTTGGLQHAITVHMSTVGTSSQAVTNGTALANLLKPIMPTNCTFTGVDYAAAGSNVFNPATSLSIAGTGGGTTDAINVIRYLSFVGRNLDGRKTRLFLLGAYFSPDVNWRVETSENTGVAAVVTGLNAGTGDVRCVDGLLPVWRAYANSGYSYHWLRKARQGAG